MGIDKYVAVRMILMGVVVIMFLGGCAYGGPPGKLPSLLARHGRWNRDATTPVDLTLPTLNSEELYVYKIMPKPTSRHDVRCIAARFGVHGPIRNDMVDPGVLADGKWISVRRDDNSFIVYRNPGGTPSYEVCRTLGREDYPDDEACRSIAVEFLSTHRLLPKKHNYDIGVCQDVGRSSGYILVHINRAIDEYEAICAGHFRLGVGPNGDVLFCRSWFPSIKIYGRYPVLSPEEALSALKEGKCFSFMPGATQRGVEEVFIAYDRDDREDWLVRPLYLFCGGDWRNGQGFVACVDAIRDEYLGGPGTLQPDEREKSSEKE
ncbi:MAG TPA: hypothetical protein PLO37_19020 [Candidatus Hydrogenedentes bacterium]|nr:hypothetical protein [Candidatus Hydrogenedentota bacterium]